MMSLNSNEWVRDEISKVYTTNFKGGNVSAVTTGMDEALIKNYSWLRAGMIIAAFDAMIIHRTTPQVDHKYCFNLQYVSQVLWNYKSLKMKGRSTQAEYYEPTPAEKQKIENKAIALAFKRFKDKGKVFLLHVHYDSLKRTKAPNLDWIEFKDAAKATKLLQKKSDYEQAKRDFDRHKMRSIKDELENFNISAANLEDTAKGLAVKAFFETLIKEGKTL